MEGRCPECGLAYDAETAAWTGRVPGMLYVSAAVLALGFVVAMSGVFAACFGRTAPGAGGGGVLFIILAAACLLGFAITIACIVRKPMMIVNSDGIMIRLRSRFGMVPWEEITEYVSGDVFDTIRLRDGREVRFRRADLFDRMSGHVVLIEKRLGACREARRAEHGS